MPTTRTQTVRYIRKGDTGNRGERGASLRGPQAWSDCASGYAFQSGAEGEAWVDVVLYGDQTYVCKTAHVKSATNYPGSAEDVNGRLWQLGDRIDLVATKILLATYALVKNLGVEAIEMKDADGNLLFMAKDGAVTCRTGTFENVMVAGTIRANTMYTPFVQPTLSEGMTLDPLAVGCNIIVSNGIGLGITNLRLPSGSQYSGVVVKLYEPCITRNSIATAISGQFAIPDKFGEYSRMTPKLNHIIELTNVDGTEWIVANPEHCTFE